jgi:hypothetical protein
MTRPLAIWRRPAAGCGLELLRFVFDLLRARPRSRPARADGGTGLLICAVDGTSLTVPDTSANLARFAEGGGYCGGNGYPRVRLTPRRRS